MNKTIDDFWRVKLENVQKALEANLFDASIVENLEDARRVVLDEIAPGLGGGIVSWGGSITLNETGLKDSFVQADDWEVVSSSGSALSAEEKLDARRRGLLSDLYLLGCNALTEDGVLVNLDMIGNRVAALTFGPTKVVVLAGRNKICTDLYSAMERVKEYAAPVNSMRLNMPNPCVKTASCQDCSSESRICNNWTITEKSFPAGRISVILINQDLGF